LGRKLTKSIEARKVTIVYERSFVVV